MWQPMLMPLFLLLVRGTRSELFTSTAKLRYLPEVEGRLLQQCGTELAEAAERNPTLVRFLTEAEQDRHRLSEDSTYLDNPLNSFRYLRRVVHGWQTTLTSTSPAFQPRPQCHQTFTSLSKTVVWPTADDLSNAAVALANLNRVYRLDTDQLIRGHLRGHHSIPLSQSDVVFIAEETIRVSHLLDAHAWINKTQRIFRKLSPKFDRFLEHSRHVYRKAQRPSDVSINSHLRQPLTEITEQLCRSTVQRSNKNLTCILMETRIPYLKAKVEFLHRDPDILVFHDSISSLEMEWVKNTSLHLLHRSAMAQEQSLVGDYNDLHPARLSQSAWIADDLPVSRRLSQRVQLLTGLSTSLRLVNSHAEPWQVLNYGIGGQFGLHEDSVRFQRNTERETHPSLVGSGDRLATWMYYLSDVEAGGATVFPLLKTKIEARKGTAAFWWNLNRDGHSDTRMVHAGCPVLLGNKWVANKWIREIGQTTPVLKHEVSW